jgi:hypothetical protein
MTDLTVNATQAEPTAEPQEQLLNQMLLLADRYRERSTLPKLSREEARAWLERVIPKHSTLEEFHHASRLALLKWRAEILATHAETNGGDRKTASAEIKIATQNLDPKARRAEQLHENLENWKARQLYGTPQHTARTEDYIARTRAAGQLPTFNGALENAGVMKRKKNSHQDAPKKRTRESSSNTAEQTRNFIAAIVKLADGQSHPLNHIAGVRTLPGVVSTIHCLRAARLIPWITIEHPDAEHAIVRVDQKLRDYIDDYRAGEQVPEASGVSAFVRHLRAELNRRHEVFIEERKKVEMWTTRNQHWQHYKGLVDWVLSELDKVVKD